MSQFVKEIDVKNSFFITDPNAVFDNLRYNGREDSPEQVPPVIAYEGYNFLPTNYGYRSYFGINSKLNIEALPGRCDKLFLYQLADYTNIIVALCEDGIWHTTSTTIAASPWVQDVVLTVPASGDYKEWTYTVIENSLYIYREGESSYWKSDTLSFTLTPVVPSFLTMSGQKGIFRGNLSLCFWDSLNSISWSSPLDTTDFTPSLSTLAGNAIFSGLLGKIVTIKSQGDDFVVYTTKGIVGIRYFAQTDTIWEATTVTDTAGISHPKEVTTSITEMDHFAYTNTGIKKIGRYNALNKMHSFEEIATEVYDILREKKTIVSLEFINGRFLFISVIDDSYINRITSNYVNTVDPLEDITPNVDTEYTFPSATFLMQDGSKAPIYPVYSGAFVFDTALVKWGKMKQSYSAILDYNIYNSNSSQVTSYSNLGIKMALLVNDGVDDNNIYNIDSLPTDSWMRYGKIGYTRKGMTNGFEIRAHFRLPFTGDITIDGSLNGFVLNNSIQQNFSFTDVMNANCFFDMTSRWYTVKVSGNYDLQYIEFRGTIASSR